MRAHALVLLGAPGAGKGTQARELSERLGIPRISTGDILRDAIAKRTPLGLAAERQMKAGELVPDDIMCKIVEERIEQPDCRNGFILDGFPRTLAQGEFLSGLLRKKGQGEALVLNFRVDDEVLVKRLTGRRTCPVCGRIYNIYFSPPKKEGICDYDGGKLIERADDNPATIPQRLIAYDKQTQPLIEYYRRRNALHDVDGNRNSETVSKELREILRQK
jgi:adenylate kinase